MVASTIELPNLDLKRIPRPGSGTGVENELTVSLLGCEQPVQWKLSSGSLEIRVPGAFVPIGPMVVAVRRESPHCMGRRESIRPARGPGCLLLQYEDG